MVISRCSGDEWLVTGEEVEEYTPQVGIVSNILQFISIEKYFFLILFCTATVRCLLHLTFHLLVNDPVHVPPADS